MQQGPAEQKRETDNDFDDPSCGKQRAASSSGWRLMRNQLAMQGKATQMKPKGEFRDSMLMLVNELCSSYGMRFPCLLLLETHSLQVMHNLVSSGYYCWVTFVSEKLIISFSASEANCTHTFLTTM